MSTPSELSPIERLNQAGAERAYSLANETRREAVDLAYEAIALYLEEDHQAFEQIKRDGFKEGESVGIFVKEDLLAGPETNGRPQRAFCIMLVDEEQFEVYKDTDEAEIPSYTELTGEEDDGELATKLKIYIPVTDDTFIEDFTMPPRESVQEVYLEYADAKGKPQRYMLHHEWMVEYKSVIDHDHQAAVVLSQLGAMALDTRAFFEREPVDEGVVTALEALRNIVNLHAVPQRYIEVGNPEVHDIQ